jgi:hypothetical protein
MGTTDDQLSASIDQFIAEARSNGRLKADVDKNEIANVLSQDPDLKSKVGTDNVRQAILELANAQIIDRTVNDTVTQQLAEYSEKIRANFSSYKDSLTSQIETLVRQKG